MRTLLLALILAVGPALLAQERIVVEMEPVDGLGPFRFNWTGQGPATDPIGGQFDSLEDSVLGLPVGLTDMDVRFVNLQSEEELRMGHLKGNVKKAVYDKWRRYYGAARTPDSVVFDQRLDYAVGKDAEGHYAVVFDTDNDEDLSDESVHSLPWDRPPMSMQTFLDSVMNTPRYDEIVRSLPSIEFESEVLVEGEIVPIRREVVIMPFVFVPSPGPGLPDKPLYFLGYSGHMRGQLSLDGEVYEVFVNAGEAVFRPTNTWIHIPDNALVSVGGDVEVEVGKANPLRLGDIFELGDRRFRLDRISILGDRLELVDVRSRSIVSNGDMAPPIFAELIGGEPFHLADAAGKYVLLNFWNIDCGNCYDQRMNETYETVDKSCIEFVGIGENDVNEVKDWTEARAITWPQIADREGAIAAAYGVDAYPTYVLVNPVGDVVASDGRFKKEGGVLKMLDRSLPAACFNAPTADDVTSVFWGDRRWVEPTVHFLEGCRFATEEMSVRSVGDRNPEWGWPVTLDISGECTAHNDSAGQGSWQQDLTLNVWMYQNMGEWGLVARKPFVAER